MTTLTRRTMLALAAAMGLSAGIGAAQAQDGAEIEFLYSPYADYAPFFIAKEKGYFEEFGANVTLTPKTGTAETIQLIAAGNAEAGGATWGAGLFNSIERGASVAIVGTMAKMPMTVPSPVPLMVSEQAYESGVKTAADLKGRRIGIPGPGGFGIYSVAMALEKGGLTLEDIEPVFMPPPATIPALANGSIDAAWAAEPFVYQIESNNIGRRLVEDHTLGTELGFIAFNNEFVDAHRDDVIAFLAGYLKAARELDNGGWSDPEILEIASEYTDTDVEILKHMIMTVRPETGEIDWEDVRKQEQFFRDQDNLEYEGQADIDSVYRIELLEAANDLLESAS